MSERLHTQVLPNCMMRACFYTRICSIMDLIPVRACSWCVRVSVHQNDLAIRHFRIASTRRLPAYIIEGMEAGNRTCICVRNMHLHIHTGSFEKNSGSLLATICAISITTPCTARLSRVPASTCIQASSVCISCHQLGLVKFNIDTPENKAGKRTAREARKERKGGRRGRN
jgi:hypothetical protein